MRQERSSSDVSHDQADYWNESAYMDTIMKLSTTNRSWSTLSSAKKMTHVYIYIMQMQWGGNNVGPTCKHGCHINGLIKSSIDQDDEHINVVADDTGIFAFLWLWYSRLFGKWKTTSVSTMIKWWVIPPWHSILIDITTRSIQPSYLRPSSLPYISIVILHTQCSSLLTICPYQFRILSWTSIAISPTFGSSIPYLSFVILSTFVTSHIHRDVHFLSPNTTQILFQFF